MVERRSHEDQNNGHPGRRVGTVLDVTGAKGAFHLQSVSECVLVCVNVAALSGHCAAASS